MKVRIKSGECPSYLTVGKVYEVINEFYIKDDNGHEIPLYFNKCSHLNGGSWEIVDE